MVLCTWYMVLTIHVIHMNVRSMKNKRDEILDFLTRSGIKWDIICISETWLKDDIIQYYNIESYNLFASCRHQGEGDGTAIYAHTNHDVIERKDLESLVRNKLCSIEN